MAADEAQTRSRLGKRAVGCVALFIAWGIIPVLLLVGVEAGLRYFEIGRSTQFLFSRETPNGTAYSVNLSFYKQFLYVEEDTLGYAPFDLPIPTRADNTYRVVVLGSSAALGWYFSDFAFSRYLEAMLRDAYPTRKIEVISVAWFGMNSHVMRVVAEHFDEMNPDLLVVYTGNNEMTGPFGLMSRLGAQQLDEAALDRAIRRHVWLSNVRLLQILGKGAQNLSYSAVGGMRWGFDAPVSTIDDARLERVYRHYELNLDRISAEATRRGVPVLLGTLLRNERDWKPRNSFRPAEWTEADEAARNTHLEAAEAALAAGNHAEARGQLEAAVALDPAHAHTLFRLAQCLHGMGDIERAAAVFSSAYEHDATLDYATPKSNEAVRAVAKARGQDGVYLVDAAREVAELSPDGLLGREMLYDHIHLTRTGNYHLARAFAERVPLLPEAKRPAPTPRGDWLSFEAANAWLGDSAEGLAEELSHARDSIVSMWPEQDTAWLDEQRAMLEQGGHDAGAASRMEALSDAMDLNSDDFLVRYRFVERGLSSVEHRDAAIEVALQLSGQHPDYWRSHFAQLQAHQYRAQAEDALRVANELVDMFPYFPESHLQRARALSGAGHTEEALQIFGTLARRFPESDMPFTFIVEGLRQEGRHEEALEAAARRIHSRPDSVPAYQSLDSVLVTMQDPEQRVFRWQKLADEVGEHGHAHHFLSQSLASAGRAEEAAKAQAAAAAAKPERYGAPAP